MCQLAVTILIKFRKGSAQVCNLRLRYARSNVSERSLPQPRLIHVLFNVANHLWVQLDEIVLLVTL